MLIVAGYLFSNAYGQYALNRQEFDNLSCRARLLQEHKKEQEQKKAVLAKAEQFVDRARSLGLEKKNWDYYDVNIEERVFFHETQKILTQTVNSKSFYFKPISLYIKKSSKQDPTSPSQQSTATSTGSKGGGGGDVVLSLRGTFVVRQK